MTADDDAPAHSEEWVQRILSQLTDVVLVFDSAGEITYITPSITRLNGTDDSIHVGTSAFGDVHPDDLEEVTSALATLLDDPESEVRVTFRLKHVDGHYVWVEAIATNGLVDPAVRGIIATVRDITTLKQAEQMFRGLVEAAPDAMVLVDRSGSVVLANERAEQLLGWAPRELIGKPIETLIPESVRADHVQHRTAFVAAPRRRRMGQGIELVARHRDGHEVPVEVSLSPHETHLGLLVSAAIRDITDQRETRRALEAALAGEQEVVRRLEDANELKAGFVSTVAHELRNPLTTIGGFAHLIEQAAASDPTNPQIPMLAGRISANATRLLDMIDQLLRFSRLEAGHGDFDLESLDLTRALQQSIDLLGDALTEHTVHVEVSPGLTVWADADGLANVVRNLLGNAAKFAPEGTTITIGALDTDEGVVVSVTDEGPGVPVDRAEQIFEQFEQTDLGRAKGGTGLGLSIAQRYVELHHGRIWIDRAHRDGARFCFLLPHQV